MLRLAKGMMGARRWRQLLSDARKLQGNDARVIHEAWAALRPRAA